MKIDISSVHQSFSFCEHKSLIGGFLCFENDPLNTPPRPTVGVDKTRERWDNFLLNWTQFKEDSDLGAKEVSRQLVACCSDELQTILNRNLGNQ